MSSFAEGKEWLLHTAANMVTSMAASRRFLTAAAAQRLDTVLSVGNLWPFGLVFAGWALVRVVGGPVGVAVTSALRLWGAYSAVDSVHARHQALGLPPVNGVHPLQQPGEHVRLLVLMVMPCRRAKEMQDVAGSPAGLGIRPMFRQPQC